MHLILGDCMDYLKDYPDNHFSLSICDPPYGLGKRIVDGGSISPLIKSQKGIVKKWDKKPNFCENYGSG